MNENLLALLAFIIILICFGGLFWIGLSIVDTNTDAYNTACQEIGFKSWTRSMGQDYCEDLGYNLNYVKMINIGDTFDWRYRAVEISIGDVTTKRDAPKQEGVKDGK